MMDLGTLWFVLIAVLFIGFFFLEGFDYGVGILHPFIAKDDSERRMVINTIGPFWDGNEVWLLTAGGAMFAAFPNWYATMFSGFYLALVVILLALILRGVAFEFRSKDDRPGWRRGWDWALFFGSAIPALLWGVAVGNLARGVPIDADMHYVGTFFDLLNPYSLVGGVLTFGVFTLHGALFLTMKASGEVEKRAKRIVKMLWLPVIVVALIFGGLTLAETNLFDSTISIIAFLLAAVALVGGGVVMMREQYGWAFLANGLAIVFVVVTVFAGMFPNVMISSLDVANNLTITNASSSEYTLSIMTVIALFFVPIVLIYQGWTYWVFRQRVTADSHLEY